MASSCPPARKVTSEAASVHQPPPRMPARNATASAIRPAAEARTTEPITCGLNWAQMRPRLWSRLGLRDRSIAAVGVTRVRQTMKYARSTVVRLGSKARGQSAMSISSAADKCRAPQTVAAPSTPTISSSGTAVATAAAARACCSLEASASPLALIAPAPPLTGAVMGLVGEEYSPVSNTIRTSVATTLMPVGS